MTLLKQQIGRNATGKTIGRKTGRKIADSAGTGRNEENLNLANYAHINKLAPRTSRRIAGNLQKIKPAEMAKLPQSYPTHSDPLPIT